MRPTRLVVEGFTAFRDCTEVDFEGADLFAFTGPTGAGKSSLIDAMVFALYGSVPRLDRRAVAPVISLGRNEARVVLDFTVDGVAHTAARVVRRTKTGATTKEARLERGGEVLAGNERELTEAVEDLLGLTIDHFTTAVVLPQGEFMRLLHAKASERQALLVSLLDLGLYDRMARVARTREQSARHEADVAAALLEQVAFATAEGRTAAAARAAALTAAQARVAQAVPELDRLRQDEAEARRAAEAAEAEVRLLAGVAVPEGLHEHAGARAEARRALADVEAAAEARRVEAEEAAATLETHPERSGLEAARAAHAEREKLVAQAEKGSAVLAEQERALAVAEEAAVAAEQAADHAVARLERAQWEHRAHDLAAGLVVGDPCPVCRQDVTALPDAPAVQALEHARAEREAADRARTDARAVRDGARRDLDRTRAKLEQVTGRSAELEAVVASHPDPAALEAALVARTEAEAAERSARELASRSLREVAAARKAVDRVDAAEAAARKEFDRTRDRLATLGPPPAGREDLSEDWTALAEWAVAARPSREEAVEVARAAARTAAADLAAGTRTLSDELGAVGVRPGADGDLRGPVARALAEAEGEVAAIDRALADAVTHRATVEEATRRADLARELHRLLNASNFEKWVLDEAVAVLVEGATELLLELSGGAYSLALDERANFLVVDHRNADEVRPARTLSGGETFLASLALALALADQIGSLAADGSARLESIFLDEGFGTLDPDALDVVAAAIEELGATGRMVGLVSHVAELAERVPVRFQVTRTSSGSSVEKIVA